MEAMNQGGVPRFTGNAAHVKFVDMLDSGMKGAGLQTARDSYTFPRWEAKKWSLYATPNGGSRMDLPVTFYYPHSGQTGPQGVTGPLVYGGKIVGTDAAVKSVPEIPADVNGKIVFIDYEIEEGNYNEWYRPWGFNKPDTKIPSQVDGMGNYPHGGWSIAGYKKAGAAGVIFGWTNLSDEQATGQNWPFGGAIENLPALLVGRDTGAKLRQLTNQGATATIVLEADVFQNAGTDTLIATLPGASNDEVVIVYTHTDGPNAIQENGAVPIMALAKYFAKVPQGSRKRTMVFVLVTGHDVGAYVPGQQGSFVQRHPDIVKKAVASVTIEHLGCREWHDDESHTRYMSTGKQQLGYAQTHHETLANLELQSVSGTAEQCIAVVEPTPKGRYLGIGGALANTGMPTLGFFGAPSYLNIVAADGCMSKLSQPLMYGQIVGFAKLLHKIDATPASDLKWLPAVSGRGAASSG